MCTRRAATHFFCHNFVATLLLVCACFKLATTTTTTTATAATHDATASCWSRDDVCVIRATLRQWPSSDAAIDVPLDITCPPQPYDFGHHERMSQAAARQTLQWQALGLGKQQVVLDGCHTSAFRTNTYGFELLPQCESVSHVTVQRFRGDVLQQFYCGSAAAATNIEVLRVSGNEIGTIPADALASLTRLRELHFFGNSLLHIDRTAFDDLTTLAWLQIENEKLLALKEGDLLERLSLATLRLSSLLKLTSQLYEHLPRSLLDLYVSHTPVDGGIVSLTNPQQLRNISIIGSGLRAFTLVDDYGSVLSLNLSRNAIVDLQLTAVGNNTVSVQTLDLSENYLSHLQWHWFKPLAQLRRLVLHGNLLQTLSLSQLLAATPTAQLIDVTDNKLMTLQDTALQHDYERIRIQIDRNPWNCVWLLNFAHTHPEKFRIFQYDKYISQINVNGLTCNVDVDAAMVAANHDTYDTANGSTASAVTLAADSYELSTPTEASFLNVSTYTLVYGNPWEHKRNQRAEALIIVFMLPLGIAFLFLLLYLWIYCQRMFHLSYYRTIPLIGLRSTASGGVRSAERYDVVRQLPPTSSTTTMLDGINNNEGYELPINGVGNNVCNCHSCPAANGGVGNKCQKAHHHITYVAIPPEPPYKIYEEIMEEPRAETVKAASVVPATAPEHSALYDHLSFEEAVVDNLGQQQPA